MTISKFEYDEMQRRLAANKPLVCKSEPVPDDAVPSGEEGQLQREIAEDCNRRHWSFAWNRTDRAHTGTVGQPDFIIFAHYGITLIIECKTRTGKLSIEQTHFRNQVVAMGHVYHIVRSVREWKELAG